jgi:hypothetical protein
MENHVGFLTHMQLLPRTTHPRARGDRPSTESTVQTGKYLHSYPVMDDTHETLQGQDGPVLTRPKAVAVVAVAPVSRPGSPGLMYRGRNSTKLVLFPPRNFFLLVAHFQQRRTVLFVSIHFYCFYLFGT